MKWNGVVASFEDIDELSHKFDEGHYVSGHPSIRKLEDSLTEIFGRPTIVTSRGSTAIELVLRNGKDVFSSADIYPGTKIFLQEEEMVKRIDFLHWFDPARPDDLSSRFEKIPDRRGLIVFAETIGNSKLMPVADVQALLNTCKGGRAELIVDATFTPFFEAPNDPNLIIVGSLTKYGQPDDRFLGGWISGSAEVIDGLRQTRAYQHVLMLPEVAEYFYETTLNMKSRFYSHCSAVRLLTDELISRGVIANIWYPGLKSHPQHDLIIEKYDGFAGGVFYFQLKGGEAAAVRLANLLRQLGWKIEVSFGSNDFRILPFVGSLRKHVDCDGLVRIATGRAVSTIYARNFKDALDYLKG